MTRERIYGLAKPPSIRASGQTSSMIVDGSPLAIIGIFVAFLRM